MASFSWSPLMNSSSGGVPIYSTFSAFPAANSVPAGSLAVAADSGIIYESNGTIWQAIAAPGDVLSVGAFGSTPNANGLSITSNVLQMQPADGTHPGGISTTAQTFGGDKTFTGNISAANLSGTNSGDVSLGTANGLSLVGQALSLTTASTSTTGALTSTDWNTFNGKQPTGSYLTALTGDGTATGPGSAAFTLATVNTNVGTFAAVTVNGKGLVTAATALSGDGTTSGAALTVTGLQNNPINPVTPTTGYILTWDGSQWSPIAGIAPIVGASLTLWPVNTNIIAGPGTTTSVRTLLPNPTVSGLTSSSIVVNANTLLIDTHLYNTALGVTSIPSGAWNFNTYAQTSATSGTPQLIINVVKAVAGAGTVTVTGSGTTRTVTATSSMFVSGDFSATLTSTSYVQLPGGIFPVASFSSGTVVTITTPSGYVNDGAGSAYSVYRVLFNNTFTLTSTASLLYLTSEAQPSFAINATDKLAFMYYGTVTASSNHTITYFQDGTAANSSIVTPLTGIPGLGAGVVRSTAAGILSSAELSGDVTTSLSNATTLAKIQGTVVSGTTGTTNVVFSSGPTLTNPIVGTQSASDNSTKAASTAYVTSAIATALAGINPAIAVQAATTAAGDTSGLTYNNGVSGIGATFTGSNNTAITVDGFTFTALGQRLLVKNDTQSPSGAFNGVYYVTQLQASLTPPILTRALDYDMPSDINNTGAIPVVNGTVNGTTSWVLTSQVTTVGTDPLTYVKFTVNPSTILTNPMTTQGDIIYGGSSGTPTRLAGGTAGQILQTNGSSGAPSWVNPISGDNLLTNSAFDYWQAGTSFTVTATGGGTPTATFKYGPDQWYVNNILGGGTIEGVITISQYTGVVNGSFFGTQVQITTAPTGTGIQNGCEFWTVLSNKASIALYGQTASFSAQLQSLGNVNQVGIQFFYNTTESKSSPTAIGSETTFALTTGAGHRTLCAINGQALGTSQTTAGVILVRIRITGVSSGNTYDVNNGFQVEQAMLNIGSVAVPFSRQFTDPAQELASCQYFYEKSYSITTNPGTSTAIGTAWMPIGGDAATNYKGQIPFKVTKRIDSSSISFWDQAGNASRTSFMNAAGTVSNNNNTGSQGASSIGMSNFIFDDAPGSGNFSMGIQWVSNAQI